VEDRLLGSSIELCRLLRLHFLRFIAALPNLSVQNSALDLFVCWSSGEVFALFLRQGGRGLNRSCVEIAKRNQSSASWFGGSVLV
jgi:hypothetical protein